MNYRLRDTTYIFTVTKGQLGEDFFKKLRKYRPAGVQLYRMGRNRNRKQLTRCRHQGRLPLELSDRWDLYVRVPYLNDWKTYQSDKAIKSQAFITMAASVIKTYQSVIQYANGTHKPILDHLFNSVGSIPSRLPDGKYNPDYVPTTQTKTVKEGMEWSTKHNKWEPVYTKVPVTGVSLQPTTPTTPVPMVVSEQNLKTLGEMAGRLMKENQMNTKTSIWKVTLKSEISVQGDTHADLLKTLKSMGFLEQDLVSYEKVDLHLDLPLISFYYPEHGNTSNRSTPRRIRVTKMDANMIEGFEGDVWKKFLRSKTDGPVYIVEIPQKA